MNMRTVVISIIVLAVVSMIILFGAHYYNSGALNAPTGPATTSPARSN